MTYYFHETGTVPQVILLVLSLLTVIILTASCVLSFRHRLGFGKKLISSTVLLSNAALYVAMQVDNSMTSSENDLHLPFVFALAVTVISLAFAVWSLLNETRNRKTLGNESIKEAFDNLPMGVCFFNEAGLPVLCNRAMHRFSFNVSGKDVQYITDLNDVVAPEFVPIEGVVRDGKIFTVSDNKAWQIERRSVSDEMGTIYTQFIASDVSDLQRNRVELTLENDQLRKTQAELKRLSANVVTVTREEEILNAKMRVHDEMGRCLLEARKYLLEDKESIPRSMVHSWHRAVSMLKYNNEPTDDDMLSQIRQTCDSIGLMLVQSGALPSDEATAYLLTCAVRECVTNAVRHAGADKLYVSFSETQAFATVNVTNNGVRPDREIVEGGGLSTLRRRIERIGGTMNVQSNPMFKLTVTVPKGKEGIL